MPKQRAKIDNWRLIPWGGRYALTGHVTGHPRQAEFHSETQLTSKLLSIDLQAGIAETANTLYTLGTPA